GRRAGEAAGRRSREVGVGPPARAGDPLAGADPGARVRPLPGAGRPVHSQRRRRPGGARRPELADGRRPLDAGWLRHRARRPEREPGVGLVRRPGAALVGRALPAAADRRPGPGGERRSLEAAAVSRLAVVALAAAGGLVTAAGLTQGWWWPAFGLGLGLGLATGRRARALAGGVVLGAIGWGLPLGLLLAAVPEARRLALVLSAILGARAAGVPAVALTL